MKRKRGHKKGKSSKTDEKNVNETSVGNEVSEHSSSDAEVDAPSPVAASVVDPVKSVVGRVKVKLKTSKAPEPVKNSPQAEAKKPVVAVEEKPVVVVEEEKKEETVVARVKPVFINVYRKTKGIKIKSSKRVVDGSSSVSVSEVKADVVKAPEVNVVQKDTKAVVEKEEGKKKELESVPVFVEKEEEKKSGEKARCNKQEVGSVPVSVEKEEKKKSGGTGRYSKQELDDSLTVIKKIMKMEAADPFNVPVNPEALGIPDYFDIIKTPMDFGTICGNLEKGDKYMNSEDVFRDVQYIWNNCSQYNKKGDYIVDLMKRVKKNFMKYWSGASLFTEQSAGENEDGGKASSKGSQPKQKSHKRHGRHHKSDCMCAVCILMRRKRERQPESHGQSGAHEESSPVRSLSVGNSSINMVEEQDMDIDAVNKTGIRKTEIVELDSPVAKRQKNEKKREVVEVEDVQEEEENVEEESENKTEASVEDKTQSVDRVMEKTVDEPLTSAADKLVVVAPVVDPKLIQNEQEAKEKRLRQQKELQELERKKWRAKMHEKFQVRNPQLFSLCETLFPSNNKNSVWSGPHSLFKRKRGPNRSTALHKAVESLMK